MATYTIHPIFMGTKIFDQSMMTHQYGQGRTYTIPIYREIRAMEMMVIPPGTHINSYAAYDILVSVKEMADILIPLHEPRFACMDTIG